MNSFCTEHAYIGYEYKQIVVDSTQVSAYLDGYKNFGWFLDENHWELKDMGKTVLYLKRNRKIVNKVELTRLQRHYEDCMSQIQRLEAAKTKAATIAAMTVGILGTAFMAASVMAITIGTPHIIWGKILSIPGILGWIFPYFLFQNIKQKKTEQTDSLIDEKYNELYEICEKGHNLLAD